VVARGDEIWVLYPLYFDKSASRLEGRRVPKALSMENPRAEEIEFSLKSQGISCAVEMKPHPSRWNAGGGRVLVRQAKRAKGELMILAAKGMLKARQDGTAPPPVMRHERPAKAEAEEDADDE